MSNEQNRGTPILNLEDIGGVQATSPQVLKFDVSPDLSASSDPSSDLVLQSHSDALSQAASQDSPGGSAAGNADTALLHQASETPSNTLANTPDVVSLPIDGSETSQTGSFAVAMSNAAALASDSFASFAPIHSQFGVATADFSAETGDSLFGIHNLLGAHLNGALEQHQDVDAASGPIVAGSGGGDPTGALFFGTEDNTTHNDAVDDINSDGTDQMVEFNQYSAGLPSGDTSDGTLGMQAIGFDTVDNLYFGLGTDLAMTVGKISTGAVLTTTQLGSLPDGDVIYSFAVDPANDTIYAALFGADYLTDGSDIIKITYNPTTGALTSPYNPAGDGSTSVDTSDILVDSTSSGGIYEQAKAMQLSTNGATLYYVDENFNNGGGDYDAATNGIYSVSTTGSVASSPPTPVQFTSNANEAGGFPVDGSRGFITGIAVDQATDKIYFTTSAISGIGSTGIWYVSLTGGADQVATEMSLPGGVTLNQPSYNGNNLTIDQNSQTLYVADDGGSGEAKIIQLVLDTGDSGATFSSGNNDFLTIDSSNGDTPLISLDFDSLSALTGLSATSTHAVQGGSAVNLLTADPTITPYNNTDIMTGATVAISSGTAQSGDKLLIDGNTSGTLDGISYSYNAADYTLTLSGNAVYTAYETVLDAVSYQDTGTDTTTTGSHPTRTIDWTISNGVTLQEVTSADPNQGSTTITIDRDPTVTTGGTATFDGGGSAVALDAGATAKDLDGSDLTGATVTISAGYISGDTLNFSTQNGITGSYNDGTLTLSGSATAADYQTALDSITYSVSPSNGDPTNGGSDTSRTISWVVSSSVGNSNTGTSTLDTVHEAPTVAASGSVNYAVGGSAVTLDSGLTATAPDSGGDLHSATVSVLGGSFSTDGDTLSATVTGTSITASYDASDETLTLTGPDTLAHFESVLDSVTFSSTGATTGSRTIDWTVNDGVDNSTTGTSTVIVSIPAPTVTAGGTATFDGGGSSVALDPGLTVTNQSGELSSATVTVAGAIAGDTLNFTNSHPSTEGNIAVSSDSDGVLVLTSAGDTATLLQWETALESVTYSFTPSDGDPTNGGGDTSRTIDWQVTSTVGGTSNTAVSTLDTVHVAPTVTASGTVSYTAGGPAVVLDAGLTLADPDSGGNLTGATISLGEGSITGDTLNFTTQNGITGVQSGNTLTLSGTASIADYQAALESITYTFTPTSGDPTDGGSDPTRTISWRVTDGVGSSNFGTSTLDVSADVAPTVSSLSGSATSGADFASGYTATFTLDVSKDVTVAGGTTISLSDGGTATYVSGSGTTTLTFTYDATDAPQALTVTGISAGSIEDSAGKSLSISGTAISPYSDAVTDSAANVATYFASLNSAVSYISSITLNNGGTPNLDLTASEVVNDQTTIGKIVSSYNLILNDSAAAIGSDFDSLETYASAISAVIFTDSGTPTLDLTQTEVTNDASLLGKVQGPYDLLVSDVTGQAYTSYQNDYNAADTLTVKTEFNTNSTESIYAYVSDLTLAGSSEADKFYLESAPRVTVTGGSGDDTFFFGTGFSSYDHITGGTGSNTLELDGTYNALTISTSMMSNIQTLHLATDHSYNITLDAGVLTTGETLAVDGAQLASGDSLTFDASAITAGTLTVSAGAGMDDLTGGGGTNIFNMGADLTSSDEINGGTGTTTVDLDGDYSGGLTFTATTMVNVQTLALAAGHSYDLVMNAATVADGQTLTVNGGSLGAGDSLTFDGSAVIDGGRFVIHGGDGTNNLTGGSGNDTIYAGNGTSFITGGGGADLLVAGTGADTFAYDAVSDSTSTIRDTISGFNTSLDKIDLLDGLSGVTVIDTAVTTGNLSNTNFDRALAADIGAAQLSAHGAVLFTPSTGGLAGDTFLIIDENGVAGYQAGQDLVIELTHGVNLASLSLSNFETVG